MTALLSIRGVDCQSSGDRGCQNNLNQLECQNNAKRLAAAGHADLSKAGNDSWTSPGRRSAEKNYQGDSSTSVKRRSPQASYII
jgi:hypothetical protein